METGRRVRRFRSVLFLRGAAALAVLVLLGTLLGNESRGPAASGSVAPGAIAATDPASSDGPDAAGGDWAKVELSPDMRLADIQASRVIGRDVATGTAFTVRRLGSVAAADLAAAITATPPIAFSVQPGATADTAVVAPAHALEPGTRYRLALTAPDGSLAGTWTFRTASPLHVVSRIPDDRATDVPRQTGIEVTFDQDGPTGFAAHFAISPKVSGRFEQHGRTSVFVPLEPLAPATLYTVTVTHGVGVSGSSQVLEADVRWQFATTHSTAQERAAQLAFPRAVIEARPGRPVAFVLQTSPDEQGTSLVTSTTYAVYRIPSLPRAVQSATALLSVPDWATGSAVPVIDTSGLQRVASGTAPVTTAFETYSGLAALSLPVQLDPGWYLVVLPNGERPAQAVLQVTDLAAYVMTTQTRTVAWVNDLATQRPVPGASVAIAQGAQLGQTGDGGLLTAPTPASLIDPWLGWEDTRTWPPHVLTISAPDGRAIIAPLGMLGYGYPADLNQRLNRSNGSGSYWLLLATDRGQYRQTDTIHAWGVVKARDDGSVPGALTLRLTAQGQRDAVIARTAVSATSAGVFVGDLQVRNLPTGQYEVLLYAGSTFLQSSWVEIAVIRKPAYVVNVATDHLAYIDGDTIAASGDVAFYDGSHIPGLGLQVALGTTSDGQPSSVVTGADGQWAARLGIAWNTEQDRGGFDFGTVTVRPRSPEEGAISGERSVLVFPSAVWLEGETRLDGTRLSMTGRISRVDIPAAEAAMKAGTYPDAVGGAGLPGQSVTVRVIHHVPVRHQVGTAYDFITKQTVPLYTYDDSLQTLASRTLVAGTNGALSMNLTVPVAGDGYEVELRAVDAKGRPMLARLWAQTQTARAQTQPYLVEPLGCGLHATTTGAVGATSALTVHEHDGTVAADGNYLFLVGERGLTDAVIQSSSTLRRTFTRADLPSYVVSAVRLTASGYEPSGAVEVQVEPATKALTVRVSPIKARYAPGDVASVSVRTLRPDGSPVAADVIVRAVDEKLFTLGSAGDVDALAMLLAPPGDGFLQSYTSHLAPAYNPGGCGGSGGVRSDFADSATFQRVRTDSSGRATVTFKLPDDLTSWHVTATAVSADLDAGTGTVLVPVGLPFFVDAIVAPEYLAGDRPSLLVRAYGAALPAGAPVRFVIRAGSLGTVAQTIDGRIGTAVRVPLASLAPGEHDVTIEASAAGGSLSDAVIRHVRVIPTRLTALRITQQTLADGAALAGGPGLTTYVVTDAGRASLFPVLQAILGGDGARFDQAAGASVARQLLLDEFEVPAANLPNLVFDGDRYLRGGIALLPYASPDLPLTALAAFAVPDRIDPAAARQALVEWLATEQTRERQIIARAGQAALGVDVLDELGAFSGDLTIREQIWLGMAYLASGDETRARSIERAVLAANGQQLETWVRLNAGPDLESTLDATSLMLMLSAGVGDPLAAGMARYVLSQPSREHVFSLELLASVRSSLERLPRTPAAFAWTLDGERHTRTLAPGEAFAVTVMSSQRPALTFELTAGQATVTTTWIDPTAAAALPATPGITIGRTVSPASDAPADRIVKVRLSVAFAAGVPTGCYEVTDLVPSGLAPLVNVPGWPEDPETPRSVLAPYAADGQRVSWCIEPDSVRSFSLAYSARVVTPGTYRWEPATVQLTSAPTIGAATTEATYTIR